MKRGYDWYKNGGCVRTPRVLQFYRYQYRPACRCITASVYDKMCHVMILFIADNTLLADLVKTKVKK